MQRPAILTIVISSCVLASVHCKDDASVTRVAETTIAPVVPAPDGGASFSPGPMPASSCGLVGTSVCDPITGWPCNVAEGEVCDYSNTGGRFQCYPGPNTAGFCGACGFLGPGCGVGFTCNYSDWCERHCCDDDDCGSGTCVLDYYGNPNVAAVGFCQAEGIRVCLGGGDAGAVTPPSDAGSAP
jgi:hypothetical protein